MRRARSVVSVCSIICRENRVKYQSSCSNKAAERASAPAEHRCRQRVRQAQGVGGRQYPEAVEPRAARAQHCRRATVASSLLLALSRSVLRACVRACWHACQLSVYLCVFVWDSDVAGVLEDPAGRTSLHDSNYRYLFRPLLQSIKDSIPKILFYHLTRLINVKMELLFMFLKPKWCC